MPTVARRNQRRGSLAIPFMLVRLPASSTSLRFGCLGLRHEKPPLVWGLLGNKKEVVRRTLDHPPYKTGTTNNTSHHHYESLMRAASYSPTPSQVQYHQRR